MCIFFFFVIFLVWSSRLLSCSSNLFGVQLLFIILSSLSTQHNTYLFTFASFWPSHTEGSLKNMSIRELKWYLPQKYILEIDFRPCLMGRIAQHAACNLMDPVSQWSQWDQHSVISIFLRLGSSGNKDPFTSHFGPMPEVSIRIPVSGALVITYKTS